MEKDRLLIKNGVVYDGLGGEPYQSDLLIMGDRIAAIGRIDAADAQVIDAEGMVVCPGFVDIHRHCDMKPFIADSRLGVAELSQGITTVVAGNCGFSMAPQNPNRHQEAMDYVAPVLGEYPAGIEGIFSFKRYMDVLETKTLPFNMAAMIGTGAVRISLKGFANTPFTQGEMAKARRTVEEAMQVGAAGASVGIMYIPECYGNAKEFAQMLEPVGRYQGVVTAHIRGEGDSLTASVREIIDIGKMADCPVHISHFKSCGANNWRREIHKAIELIEAARAMGQDVTCDFYPYDGGSTTLATMLPPEFVNGDFSGTLERLGTRKGVEAFRIASLKQYDDWDNYVLTLGWDRIIISGVTQARNERYLGMSVEAAAKAAGFVDGAACAAHLLHDEAGKVAIIIMSMCQEDIDTVAALPYSMVVSDAIYGQSSTPHPRMYGAFPKIIREYVHERGVYTLEEAIRRMTDCPARRMNLHKRGRLATGFYADVNIFDPAELRDNATYTDSTRLATGLRRCIVNGRVAKENERIYSMDSGVVIRPH